MEIKNIYAMGTSEKEIDVLSKNTTHDMVAAKSMLNIGYPMNIVDKILIDFGSGPSPKLSLASVLSGCRKYIAVDRENVLQKIKTFYDSRPKYYSNFIKFISVGNIDGKFIQNIDCGYCNFNDIICHMQMLLMHIQEKDVRKDIIRAILLKGKTAIFTETNWGSFDLNSSEGVLKDLKKVFKELLSALGINGNYNLFGEINEVIKENNFSILASEIPITISDEEAKMESWRELVEKIEQGKAGLSSKPDNNYLVVRLQDVKERLISEKPFILRPTFSSVITSAY